MKPACAQLANRNCLLISIKLVAPKPFNGNNTQAQACLSTLKCYFIVVGITYETTKATNTKAACQYAVVLMGGNAYKMNG